MRATLCTAVFAITIATLAHAAPFLPSDDAQVLERLPERASAQNRELKRLREAAAAAPNDVARAVALANAYYAVSHAEGDPRYLGYAQATLAPWWNDPQAPTPVLVSRALILQSNHEFDRALADLGKALAREPRNGQARLVRANILTVQGKYAEARADCGRLLGIAPEPYVSACIAAVDSVNGKAADATAALTRALAALPPTDVTGRSWIESLLGEVAHRRGDPSAERHFRAALAADPRDLYTIGAYADWLLDNARAAEVIALVSNQTRVDALLLRLALAQKMAKRPEVNASVAALRARFAATRARGDTVHRREEARFALELDNDPKTALRLALDNFEVQREPADVRVLAEAAAATGNAEAAEVVRKWLAHSGLEYTRVRQ
jgi:tetratricopeptide (TPR) repeat protein